MERARRLHEVKASGSGSEVSGSDPAADELMTCLLEAHGYRKGPGRRASRVLSALTGCHSVGPSPYLSLACGLRMATPRGWQRKAGAVSVAEAGSSHGPPLQMHHILSLSPRISLGDRDEHPRSYIPSAPVPPFCQRSCLTLEL